MFTSHKLTLAVGLFTLASLNTGCNADVKAINPGQSIPFPNGNGQVALQTPTPAPIATPAPVVSAVSQNLLYGFNYQGPLYGINLAYAAGDEVTIVRSCTESAEFCLSVGQLTSETFTLKANDPTSIHSSPMGTGETAATTLTGDATTLTLTTNISDASGNVVSTFIHTMTLSQSPCGNSANGAGMEDDFSLESITADGTATGGGCAQLFK